MDLMGNELSSNRKELEKYSSAFTLSDMEIFIFPELFYPLVLADIMSPTIWAWRADPWFKNIEHKSFTYKVNRIKQFIIQNYVFNLDLATWGLTTKTTEIERFRDFYDMDMLKQSNALFGYEGDKYYFDIDIRKHFGLDKLDSDIIPYWKTETVEAMGAFRYKENFTTGAGECVSLSALYAAAMFVIGRIPLEKIFLIATPLHSQNFITEKEGLITNNRRIVTKNMWFNGTSLSEKARRALENEKVTIVSHISGHIHTLYDKATIRREAYEHFSKHLNEFLVTDLTNIVFINFLRFKSKYKSLFQYRCDCSGTARYLSLEKMFEYEHSSKNSAAPESREALIREIEGDEFHLSPIHGKLIINDFEAIINKSPGMSIAEIESRFIEVAAEVPEAIIREMFRELRDFTSTEPNLPDINKDYVEIPALNISVDDTREVLAGKIKDMSGISEMARLTLYVYRQMDVIDWLPFVKAAIERNPVSFKDLEGKNPDEVYEALARLTNESIYDGQRLALPDEVWNFRRGDGIEKALLLATYIHYRDNNSVVTIDIEEWNVTLRNGETSFNFTSEKGLRKRIEISGKEYLIT